MGDLGKHLASLDSDSVAASDNVSSLALVSAWLTGSIVRGSSQFIHHFELTLSDSSTDGFSYIDSDVAFRVPIGLQLLFAVLVTLIVFGLPESPRWLAKRGREQEAIQVLCDVYDLPEDDPYVQGEIEAIRAAIAVEKQSSSNGIIGLFKKDILKTRRRVILAWFGLFMNQWSGVRGAESQEVGDLPLTGFSSDQPCCLLHAYRSR